ncbi:MAG: hypothetical protein P8Y16_03525 [Sulfurimonas sp.]
MLPDKTPGPDVFTGLFYQSAWPIIMFDIMQALHAFWQLDFRRFHLVNQAYMVLLKKKPDANRVQDICMARYTDIDVPPADVHGLERLKALAREFRQTTTPAQQDLLSFIANGVENLKGIPMKVVSYNAQGKPQFIIQAGRISFINNKSCFYTSSSFITESFT